MVVSEEACLQFTDPVCAGDNPTFGALSSSCSNYCSLKPSLKHPKAGVRREVPDRPELYGNQAIDEEKPERRAKWAGLCPRCTSAEGAGGEAARKIVQLKTA